MSVSLIYTAAKALTFPKPWSSWLHAFTPSIHMDWKAERENKRPLLPFPRCRFLAFCWWHSLFWNQLFFFACLKSMRAISLKYDGNTLCSSVHLILKQEKGKLSTARAITRTPLPTLSCIRHKTMVCVPLRRGQRGLGKCGDCRECSIKLIYLQDMLFFTNSAIHYLK